MAVLAVVYVLDVMPLGTRLVEGVFRVMEELVEEDRSVPGGRRTGELAKELANTICLYLQMEVDYPSNHPSGWMPILDWEVQMATDKTIYYRWFKKPMATCYSILNRSAMPANIKRITLVQRGVTMLRNTRRELHKQLLIPLMEQLAETMMLSGYPEDFRRGVLEPVVACYQRGKWWPVKAERCPSTGPGTGKHQPGRGRSCWPRCPGSVQQTRCFMSPAPQEAPWPAL